MYTRDISVDAKYAIYGSFVVHVHVRRPKYLEL